MIGVFDSGVGGLTVVKEIFKELPGHQIIYFGDTARLPYGTKGADFVKKHSQKITEWLLKKGAEVIVIACNTSSAWASDFLKEKFDVPIFEMVGPVVKEALSFKKIGVIGTPGTIRSKSYENKILTLKPELEVFSTSCPLFVPLVEEGWTRGEITEKIAERYLKPLRSKDIEALILACTHYPLLEETIKRTMGRKVKIINPAQSLARELKVFLEKSPIKIKRGSRDRFFFSDEPYNLDKISHLCFEKKIKPIIKDPF